MVFTKRQNIRYVRLQERIAAIDAREDYDLEIRCGRGWGGGEHTGVGVVEKGR